MFRPAVGRAYRPTAKPAMKPAAPEPTAQSSYFRPQQQRPQRADPNAYFNSMLVNQLGAPAGDYFRKPSWANVPQAAPPTQNQGPPPGSQQDPAHAAWSQKVGALNPDAEWVPTAGAGGGYWRKKQGSTLTDQEFMKRQQDAIDKVGPV